MKTRKPRIDILRKKTYRGEGDEGILRLKSSLATPSSL
jgi:hypothetical protein